jgi:hypothetical protein
MIVSWRHGVLSHLFLNFSCGGSCFFGVSRRAKLQSVRESEVLHSKPQRGSSAAWPRQGTNSEYGLDMTWTSWNKMSKLVRRVGVAKEWEKCFALKSAKFLKHWAVPFAGHVHSWKDTTWICWFGICSLTAPDGKGSAGPSPCACLVAFESASTALPQFIESLS